MSKAQTISKDRNSKRSRAVSDTKNSDFDLCFGSRTSNFGFCDKAAFTLIEVLVVISIIVILSGLVLSTVGYVQKKGARSCAEAEIAAMSAALESYKADNGIYPRDRIKTDQVDPAASPIPTTATQFLYEQLTGVSAADLQPISGATTYFAFRRQMLSGPRMPTKTSSL